MQRRSGSISLSVALTVILGVTLPRGTRAQGTSAPVGPSSELTRDELLNRLQARQAKLALEKAKSQRENARAELEMIKDLYKQNVVTVNDLTRAKTAYEHAIIEYKDAEIELEKTRLEFLKHATFITVLDAKKYRAEGGRVMVRIRLRNDSDVQKAKVALQDDPTHVHENLSALLTINNIVVTLKETEAAKAIVGDPFQHIIPRMKLGEEASLEYALLKKELEHVTIVIECFDEEKEYTVFLKKEATQDLPTINSTQYAQQGQLGSKIRYDLALERLAKAEQSFSLVVLNLPQEISFAFIDPASKAQITQVKFNEQISKQGLDLEISIPKKLDSKLIDANITFDVLITRQSELKRIFELRKSHEDEPIPAQEIAKLKADRVSLILIPKGAGKLDIVMGNLYKEVRRGDPVQFKISVLNSGTLELHRVRPEMELPLEWEGSLTPRETESIDTGDKVLYTADVRPPPDIGIGDYTIKLRAEGYSGIETIEATDKTFTVRIAAQSNITGTLVLVGILVLLVLGIAVASVKISRR